MPEGYCSKTPFGRKRVHGSQTLMESARQHFYFNFPLLLDKLSWRTSLLMRSEILLLFVNTLTVDHIFSPQNWEKFPQQV